MRMLTALMLGLFAAAAWSHDDKDKDAAKKDMAALEGEWKMVSGVSNGNEMPEEQVKTATRTVKDGVTTIKFDGEEYLSAKFTLDPSKKPKEIDYTVTKGPNDGKTLKGIYEIDGDTVKFCFGQPGVDRPTKFEAKEDSNCVLSVWKKAEKKKDK